MNEVVSLIEWRWAKLWAEMLAYPEGSRTRLRMEAEWDALRLPRPGDRVSSWGLDPRVFEYVP